MKDVVKSHRPIGQNLLAGVAISDSSENVA
jgi:hypothetical protein